MYSLKRVCIFLLHLMFILADDCDKGVDYWCQSYSTATECGLLAYCERNNLFTAVKKDLKEIPLNPSASFVNTNEEKSSASPVKVELYYESLCPGCRAFMAEQLFPTFQKLYSTGIIDIGLYPFGNAEESKDGEHWKFECQHGKEECRVNLLESCAIHMLSHPTQFMPYIHCVEANPSLLNARKCADKLKIEWGPLSNCYNGTQGNHLQHEVAVKTNALEPPHTYVPWIVVNGKHTEEIQDSAQKDLLRFVCKTYTGVSPHICRSVHSLKKRCYK